jgi:diacylglycerol kinase
LVASRAKDVAAGAVPISVVGSIVVGFLVFGPYVRRWVANWGRALAPPW